MTWFRHRCWYCGTKSRLVHFIGADGHYWQCIYEERQSCEQRRRWRDEDLATAHARELAQRDTT